MIRVEDAEKIILSNRGILEWKVYRLKNRWDGYWQRIFLQTGNCRLITGLHWMVSPFNIRSLEEGIRSFLIKATQAAGDNPIDINKPNECIEIMTGAALPPTTDTVIGYEDVTMQNGVAVIKRFIATPRRTRKRKRQIKE